MIWYHHRLRVNHGLEAEKNEKSKDQHGAMIVRWFVQTQLDVSYLVEVELKVIQQRLRNQSIRFRT